MVGYAPGAHQDGSTSVRFDGRLEVLMRIVFQVGARVPGVGQEM